MNSPQYVSIRETAERLHLSIVYINLLIRDGVIPESAVLRLSERSRGISVTWIEQFAKDRAEAFAERSAGHGSPGRPHLPRQSKE